MQLFTFRKTDKSIIKTVQFKGNKHGHNITFTLANCPHIDPGMVLGTIFEHCVQNHFTAPGRADTVVMLPKRGNY
jgi:hypothetical protein